MHAYVSLEQDEDGYPPFDTEELEVELRHDGACTVLGVPVFTNGIAVDDIVSVVQTEDDDRWWVTSVLLASGRGTVRVVPFAETTFEEIVAVLGAIGCAAHGTDHGLVAVDVPAEVDPDALDRLLEAGRTSGRWEYDIGVPVGALGLTAMTVEPAATFAEKPTLTGDHVVLRPFADEDLVALSAATRDA